MVECTDFSSPQRHDGVFIDRSLGERSKPSGSSVQFNDLPSSSL